MIDYPEALHVLVQVQLIFIFTLDETKTHHEKRAWSSISGNPFLDYEALSSFFLSTKWNCMTWVCVDFVFKYHLAGFSVMDS